MQRLLLEDRQHISLGHLRDHASLPEKLVASLRHFVGGQRWDKSLIGLRLCGCRVRREAKEGADLVLGFRIGDGQVTPGGFLLHELDRDQAVECLPRKGWRILERFVLRVEDAVRVAQRLLAVGLVDL